MDARFPFALTIVLGLTILFVGTREALGEGFTLDATTSSALTHLLHKHRLPLVGAQVLSSAGGRRKVILYGYVATNKGRDDAERRARDYLGGGNVEIDNRVVVEPSVRRSHPSAGNRYGNVAPPAGTPLPQTLGGAPSGGPYPTPLPTIVPNFCFPNSTPPPTLGQWA